MIRMVKEKDKHCGKRSPKHPELECCIAYTPESLRGFNILGIGISGAENPHWHQDYIGLKDGTLLRYAWKGRGERWGMLPKNGYSMIPITKEEFENLLIRVGRRVKE